MFDAARGWSLALGLAGLLSGCVDVVDPAEGMVFDPCEPITLRVAQIDEERLASVDAAIENWQSTVGARLSRSGDISGQVIELYFEQAAPAFYGVYQGKYGSIAINTSLTNATQRTVTITHELGHAFGLPHVDDRASIMNRGNLELGIQPEDVEMTVAMWGSCVQ